MQMRLPLLFLALISSLLWVACQSNTSAEKVSSELSTDTMPMAVPAKQTTPAEVPATTDTKVEAPTPTKTDKKEPALLVKQKAPMPTTTQTSTEQPASTPTITSPEPTPEATPEKTKEVPAPATKLETKEPLPTKPNHEAFDALLQKYVSTSGKVNYQGFKVDKSILQAYLDDLSEHAPQADWSRNEKMAFWINAYNAYTIKLIVDNYPVSSITNLHGGKPWDVKWINIGDKTYSLNNIENDILRPVYKDARIHFAVNCAAKSCPPLHNRAYTSTNLNSTLEARTKQFINNAKFNTLNANSVEVSKIFDWYNADFGNLIEYLNKYASTEINPGATVIFKDYDWGLNN